MADSKKLSFSKSPILNIFCEKFSQNIFFASSPWKLVTNYVLEWMGLNFYGGGPLKSTRSSGI